MHFDEFGWIHVLKQGAVEDGNNGKHQRNSYSEKPIIMHRRIRIHLHKYGF